MAHNGNKGKLSLLVISQALRHEDLWGSGSAALPLITSALDEVCSQIHDLVALPPPQAKGRCNQ